MLAIEFLNPFISKELVIFPLESTFLFFPVSAPNSPVDELANPNNLLLELIFPFLRRCCPNPANAFKGVMDLLINVPTNLIP